MINVSKVGRRGQITLPRKIRRYLKIKEGDRLSFFQKGEDVILKPMNQTLLDLRGSVPVKTPQAFQNIRQEVIETHARKVAKNEA
ncbi:MAG: AbrB/MazE/SpoVT family DNA-binding domain-containing protein [Pseudomonadota bacterium]